MSNLASLLEPRHPLVEAEALQRQVLENLRRTRSEDDPFF